MFDILVGRYSCIKMRSLSSNLMSENKQNIHQFIYAISPLPAVVAWFFPNKNNEGITPIKTSVVFMEYIRALHGFPMYTALVKIFTFSLVSYMSINDIAAKLASYLPTSNQTILPVLEHIRSTNKVHSPPFWCIFHVQRTRVCLIVIQDMTNYRQFIALENIR